MSQGGLWAALYSAFKQEERRTRTWSSGRLFHGNVAIGRLMCYYCLVGIGVASLISIIKSSDRIVPSYS